VLSVHLVHIRLLEQMFVLFAKLDITVHQQIHLDVLPVLLVLQLVLLYVLHVQLLNFLS